MGKKQYRPRHPESPVGRQCEYTKEFRKASDHFEDDLYEFFQFVRDMVEHVMNKECQECEDEMVRTYQIPAGCNDVEMGYELTLLHDTFTEHPDHQLTDALNLIVIDYPKLAMEVKHIRNCFGCALDIAKTRDQQ
jgi:hypothetical protein